MSVSSSARLPELGRGRGYGGRGNGNGDRGGRTGNRTRSSSQTGKPRENILDFKFDVGPVATRAVEYERNLRYIMNYIQRIYCCVNYPFVGKS
jgi:hypothetical protein